MLFIGIDNTQKNIARVACINDDDIFEPHPLLWNSRDIEPFPQFIRRLVPASQPLLAATTILEHDPFQIAEWIWCEGGEVTSHWKEDYTGSPTPTCVPLPRPYRRAYALAMLLLHRTSPSKVLEQIHLETLWLASRLKNIDNALGWQFARHDPAHVPF